MCSDIGTASRCCAYYSVVGVLFMFWVGVMMTKQPFFVGGLENKEAAELAKNNAFGACGIFVLTFAASLYGLYFSNKRMGIDPRRNGNGSNHDDFEMIAPLTNIPKGMSDYQVELPPLD